MLHLVGQPTRIWDVTAQNSSYEGVRFFGIRTGGLDVSAGQ
jgi:hypothetical protein